MSAEEEEMAKYEGDNAKVQTQGEGTDTELLQL